MMMMMMMMMINTFNFAGYKGNENTKRNTNVAASTKPCFSLGSYTCFLSLPSM